MTGGFMRIVGRFTKWVGILAIFGTVGSVALSAGAQANPENSPGVLPRAPLPKPKSLRFGLSPKAVFKIYDGVIDRDYVKRFKTTEPGTLMRHLENEVADRKRYFRQSLLEFSAQGSKYDTTPLRHEYAYGTGESMAQIHRKRRTRSFLFINNKLWKVVDVYKLREGGKWGATYASAVAKITQKLQVDGRHQPADTSAGRPHEQHDWADDDTRVRIANWNDRVAIIYVDRKTEAKLEELRQPTGPAPDELSPSVQEVIR